MSRLCQRFFNSTGIEINAYVRCGRTLLGRAVQLGHMKCILLLLDAHTFWSSRDKDMVAEQRRKCDVNLLDYYERTPLHYAAELGRTDVLDLLLRAGIFSIRPICIVLYHIVLYVCRLEHFMAFRICPDYDLLFC